ncbi:MAG: hypothetical protein DWQ35_22915 [Planctomycetota bacterium]|nr:MAG: hypothetical protein DWQ35_22915 [Planctomycetota bacterium]
MMSWQRRWFSSQVALFRKFVVVLALLSGGPLPLAHTNAEETTARALVVAAMVDDVPIYVAEVEAALVDVIGEQDLPESRRVRLAVAMMEQIVDQRIVLHHLRRRKLAASRHRVDAEVKHLAGRLKRRDSNLAEHLATRGISEQALREEIHWRLSWQKHLDEQLTDERLAHHFDEHRRDFDGTRVRVSQILLKATSEEEIAERRAQLERLREEIINGGREFAAAARELSEAPSRAAGGDLGLIARRGEMHETIASAAFGLEPGELSRPLVTPHGVHLLQCTAVEPGEKTWRDVRDELRRAVTHQLFAEIVEAERAQVAVRFTGAIAYRDPASGRLIRPQPPR